MIRNRSEENFRKYYPMVKLKAEELRLDPELVKALITVESSWHPTAVSPKGAMGLMQLMPRTAQSLDVGDPFDPEENVAGGVRYLRMLIDYFEGDLRKALAGYNAGPTRVIRTAYFPEGSETRTYVEKVLRLYGGEHRFQYNPLDRSPVNEPVYRMVMEDGTLLFTNTLPVSGVSYR
ncbi:MAG: lytic transglycosylase domain-containing protein [Thermodesulfovibrionales bacterium]